MDDACEVDEQRPVDVAPEEARQLLAQPRIELADLQLVLFEALQHKCAEQHLAARVARAVLTVQARLQTRQ